jgi:hypothetical protein
MQQVQQPAHRLGKVSGGLVRRFRHSIPENLLDPLA